MSQTSSVVPTIALAWAEVLSKPARLESTEDHDGGAAQYDDTSVANAAKEVCFGIARFSAVAAERIVMKFGNQQSLRRLRTRSECEGRERERLAQGRAPAASCGARAKDGCGTLLATSQFDVIDEAPGLLDPGHVRHDARAQEQQPWTARHRGRRFQARTQRTGRLNKTRTSGISHAGGSVARAAIRDDHLTHDALERTRHERGKGRHQCTL